MDTIEKLDYGHSTEILSNMSNVHQYPDHILNLKDTSYCPYCGSRLRRLSGESFNFLPGEDWYRAHWECLACKWWRINEIPDKYFMGFCKIGVLYKTFDIDDKLRSAIDEIAQNNDKIYQLDTKYFEQFVGGILKEYYDCDVIHVGKSHDGGIDLVLMESNMGKIPIQVKRRTKKEKVESVTIVRELRGAMVIANHSKGIIVTTAHHFSKEALDISEPKPEHSIPQSIELIDCRRLLDIMGVLKEKTGKETLVIPNHISMQKLLKEIPPIIKPGREPR